MKRTPSHMREKKDVNVNTLFPSSLLDKLDEWAWRNRMTRSAALRALVEMAFSGDKRAKVEVEAEVVAPTATETAVAVDDVQGDIRQMLQENLRLQKQMEATLSKVDRMQENQVRIINSVSTHNDAINDIKQSLKLLEIRLEKQQ